MKSQVPDNNTLVHPATVSRISGNSVIVSLDRNVHCESCSVKSACGISDSRTREIEIVNPEEAFRINEQVRVVLKKTMGLKAVFWAYVFPFLLLITTLLIASLYLREWQAGLLAIGMLIPYYIVLNLLNSVLTRKFKISVLKLT